jgi:D-alanyl-D-alanine carboxypeptidase (penicillin-binding protein 5/6)
MELIAVVMGSESSQARFAACKSLLDYGFANYALVAPEVESGEVAVNLGTENSVRAVPSQSPRLLIDKSQRDSVHTTLELKEQIDAPVSRGQRLGTLTVKAGEQVLQQIPLVAETPVPKLRFSQLYLQLLKRLCMSK